MALGFRLSLESSGGRNLRLLPTNVPTIRGTPLPFKRFKLFMSNWVFEINLSHDVSELCSTFTMPLDEMRGVAVEHLNLWSK